ncbi:EamA family transporter [Pseudonocardia acaciae]|uniref:EamA family transporter n=1 Tax=Pseudonocardia acaciae TaxID=551276 RepID=UPI000685B090|nr:EamA family transporter [Pseudonocardia acaciae]
MKPTGFADTAAPEAAGLVKILTCAIGPCLLGTAFFTTQHLPVTPLWNAVERVIPAGLVLLAVRPALPRGTWWLRALALGVLNFGAFFALQAFASHKLPGAVVSTITALQTLLVPAFAAMFGERIALRQVGAALLGTIGVALLVLRGDQVLDPLGVTATLVLAGSAAIGLLLTRRWRAPANTHHLSTIAWQILGGGLVLLPVAFAVEDAPPAMTTEQMGAAAWLAVGATAAAFALFFGGLHRGLPPTTVSRLALLSPVVATALGWVFAHESLSHQQLLGIALVLAAQFSGGQNRTTATRRRAAADPG